MPVKYNTIKMTKNCWRDIHKWDPTRCFEDLERRSIYFQGSGEKGHLFSGILGASKNFLGFREQLIPPLVGPHECRKHATHYLYVYHKFHSNDTCSNKCSFILQAIFKKSKKDIWIIHVTLYLKLKAY